LRVFWNRVLRRIFGSKRDEVVGGWGRLHNEGFYNLYASTNITRVMKSMRISVTCSTHGRDEKCIRYFWLENLKGRDNLEVGGVDGRIILE
jgi:hypothetical protein